MSQDDSLEAKENRAEIEMLKNRFDALVKILVKEGITTKEEVEELATDLIENKGEEDE